MPYNDGPLLNQTESENAMTQAIDSFTHNDIRDSISRIENALATQIFVQSYQHPLTRAAFTEMMICLRDLMWKCERFSTRVAFTDDVTLAPRVSDVTDLIKAVRDACCHIDSPNHFLGLGKYTFIVIAGRIPNAIRVPGGTMLSNDYADDVCFIFGPYKIYLNRHIVRALNEAKQKLLPLLGPVP